VAEIQDPADEGKEEREAEDFQEELDLLDPENPENLTLDEIGSVPDRVAGAPHPFEGFPLGRKVPVGEVKISSTFLVLLKDADIFQDPSGQGVTHAWFEKDAKGNDKQKEDADGRLKPPKVKRRENINLENFHNAVATDFDTAGDGQSTKVVFDRKVTVGDREMYCAVVPSHSVRAQLVFYLDDKGKMRVDRRYMLADRRQDNTLRRVFQNVKYQQLSGERAAQKFDTDPSDQDRSEA